MDMHPDWEGLIVEDEFDSMRVVADLLTMHGIKVHVARNGAECIQMLARIKPTFIIMDLAMPGQDGWATLREIRANAELASVPVAATTAYDSALVARNVLEAGFNAYFPKPIDISTFMDDLSKLIQQ